MNAAERTQDVLDSGPAPGPCPFDWLRDRRGRRGHLRLILRAVREGWAVERRAELVEALGEALAVEDAPPREQLLIAETLRAMTSADAGPPPRHPRRRAAGPGREARP